ncbi:TIGR04141 family sporadically distributed protein [Candidatus Saccharibacteria bacterium]|nr:TIGR04141 family sporadically distributed protein [Candidatus Saccharibacteria bacterium]
MKKNKITIYLIKNGLSDSDIFDGRRAAILRKFDDNLIMYGEDSHAKSPNFVKDFFGLDSSDHLGIFSSSVKVALLVKNLSGENKVVITFGNGRHLMRQDVYIKRFGLITALNSIAVDGIKSLTKTKLESNPVKSKEQRPHASNMLEFGTDIVQDLIGGVSGETESRYVEVLGNRVTGSDALSIVTKCNIENVTEILEIILDIYKKDDYKKNYGWVDKIRDIKDRSEINNLNAKLMEHFNGLSDTESRVRSWASTPEYIDDELLGGYCIQIGNSVSAESELLYDIQKEDILGKVSGEITMEALKKIKVLAISAEGGGKVFTRWNSFKCFYAEIEEDDRIYLLVDGYWYDVGKDFSDEIAEKMDKYVGWSGLDLLDYNHKNEKEYNLALANYLDDAICCDGQLIPIGDGVELCDVLVGDDVFIHVKRYSRSAALSHLFGQGFVSGELLKNDPNFRLESSKKFGKNISIASEPRIIFAITTSKPDKFDIPFFSKVTLTQYARQLVGMGYKVELAKIKDLK